MVGLFFTGEDNAEWAWGQGTGINAGVVLLAPSWHIYQRMLREVCCPQHPAHVRGNGPEQDYLSRFWSDAPWTHIGVEYNFQQHQLYNALSPACAHAAERTLLLGSEGGVERIRLVHFSGELKPWHRHFGPGDRLSTEAFVERVLQRFSGWWMWVRKDANVWRTRNPSQEGLELGEDGNIYWAFERWGERVRELAADNPELHAKADEFVLLAQRRWDEEWQAAQARCSEEELNAMHQYDTNADKCHTCGGKLPLRKGRIQQESRRWCSQCWWLFEPSYGSRVSVVARPSGFELIIDGVEVRVDLPRFDAGRPWFIFIQLGSHIEAIGPPTLVQDGDFTPVAEHLCRVPWGCAVVIAACGFDGAGEPWSLLEACGGPEKLQVSDDSSVFAMIGVHGLGPGKAIANVGPDVAAVTRRINAKVWPNGRDA